MKELLFVLCLFMSSQLVAKNKLTYLKMERTACFGKCPVYSVEFLKTGEVIYIGKSNVKMIGEYRAKMSKTQLSYFLSQFNKYNYTKLASKYPTKSTDLPGIKFSMLVSGKSKIIKNAEAGPRFLSQIAADIDEKVQSLKWKGDVINEDDIAAEPMPIAVSIESTPDVYEFAEQMPQFPGGEAALKKYLIEQLQYPQIAKENNIEGKVYCKFTVGTEGEISEVSVLRGIGYGCDDEAIRVIKSMPRWQPGKQNGKVVKVNYTLPIFFKLK